MSQKTLYYLAIFIGSTIGGFIPELLGISWLSAWGLIGSAVGGSLGWWVVWKYASGT